MPATGPFLSFFSLVSFFALGGLSDPVFLRPKNGKRKDEAMLGLGVRDGRAESGTPRPFAFGGLDAPVRSLPTGNCDVDAFFARWCDGARSFDSLPRLSEGSDVDDRLLCTIGAGLRNWDCISGAPSRLGRLGAAILLGEAER